MHDTAGQDIETRCHPSDHESACPLAQPDYGGIVEAHRPFGERLQIFAVCGVVEPDTAFG
jgi:hypothetical protein